MKNIYRDMIIECIKTNRLNLLTYTGYYSYGEYFTSLSGNKECQVYNMKQYEALLRNLCQYVEEINRSEKWFKVRILDLYIRFYLEKEDVSSDVPLIVRDLETAVSVDESRYMLIYL